MAEWLRSGLQIRVFRFDSGCGLQTFFLVRRCRRGLRMLDAAAGGGYLSGGCHDEDPEMNDFVTARLQMVDNQLRSSNVTDHRILAAMGAVAREAFLPESRRALAYADVAHKLGEGRYLAPPAPFARLLQLAEIEQTDRILDVGAGTGYSTAVLARLGAEVTALEPVPELAASARTCLGAAGVANATVVEASFAGAGLPERSFDVVIVEGTVDAEPAELFRLLAEGGRLVCTIGRGGAATAHVFVRSGEEVAGRSEFNTALPPLPIASPTETFVF